MAEEADAIENAVNKVLDKGQMCIRDRLWRCGKLCEFPFMSRAPHTRGAVAQATEGLSLIHICGVLGTAP